MADTTPTYSLPFLELADAPDLASATEDLALAVEDELTRIDAAIATINNLAPVIASSATSVTNTTTTFDPGATPLGVTFVAPPSGAVFITLSAYISQGISNKAAIVSYSLKAGGTIGSGTVIAAAGTNRSLVTRGNVETGFPVLLQGSRRFLHTGLTPGSTYNARVELQTETGGNCTTSYRELLVEPSL